MDEAELHAAMVRELRPTLVEQLWPLRRPAVRYATAAGAECPVGASKLGGLPDLPAGVEWPTWRGQTGQGEPFPLAFWGQVDLGPVSAHVDLPVPADGLLLFFADSMFADGGYEIYGLYQDELEGARVLYAPAGSELVRAAAAPPGVRPITEALLAAQPTWTVPFPLDGAEDDDYDAYDRVSDAIEERLHEEKPDGYRTSGRHQLGGVANYIQHPVELEVAQAAAGTWRRAGGFDHDRGETVTGEGWSVLFQFDSDDALDVMLGDVGTAWWALPTAELAARDLSNARFNFQCS